MNKTISALAIALLLVPALAGTGIQYEASAQSYAPSFGGGFYHYVDGLVINGKTFDVSGYSQKIQTQNLTVGIPSDVTLKIFDNAGSYTVRTATVSIATPNHYSSLPSSQTVIQYDLSGKTTIEDSSHLIASAKGSAVYSGKFVYVTFTITPSSKMAPSNIILSSTDSRLATGYSLVNNAIAFADKTGGDTSNVNWLHHHCTATTPCQEVCGDHVCKPGEKPPAKP